MAYPMEFRVLVAAAYDECGSSIEVAEEYGCCESWVRRLVQRRRKTGSLQPLTPKRPDRHKLGEADLEQLAMADPGVVKAIDGRPVRKVIVRAPKLVNLVI